MSIVDSIILFGIMTILAAIPSTSVAVVITRSATLNTCNGIFVALGIVVADLLFVMLAILGLAVFAEAMGSLFAIVKYIGALYLIFLGFSLFKSNNLNTQHLKKTHTNSNLFISFMAGFTLTLGDIKAILFYASLFPLFIDITTLQAIDIAIIAFITIVSVGGVKLAYAFSGKKIASLALSKKSELITKKVAGGLMMGAGGYILLNG